MADNAHEQSLLETLLEQERAKMQAAFDQQAQGAFSRLRESIANTRGDAEQRILTLQNDLEAANQRNEALQKDLSIARESNQDLERQLQASTQRVTSSENEMRSAKDRADTIAKSASELAKSLGSQCALPGDASPSPGRDQAVPHQDNRGQKRKFGADGQHSPDGGLETHGAHTFAQVDEMVAQTPSSTVKEQHSPSPSESTESTDEDSDWTGHVVDTTRRRKFPATLQHVSTVKSVNTLDRPWDDLVPEKLQILDTRPMEMVGPRVRDVHFSPCDDVVVFRLMLAPGGGQADFYQIVSKLLQFRSCGRLCVNTGVQSADNSWLIPVAADSHYPTALLTLDRKMLPPTPTQTMLLLVVTYKIDEAEQKKTRLAWDELIKAVLGSDMEKLARMRDEILEGNPLPLPMRRPRSLMISSASPCMSHFNAMPGAGTTRRIILRRTGDKLHRISYTQPASVDGVEPPECVFILGTSLGEESDDTCIIVVDMEATERPLWHLHLNREFLIEGCSGNASFTLLRSKFPRSLDEWESDFYFEGYKDLCDRTVRHDLKLERYGRSN